MTHEFVILVNGELKTYHNYDDIPEKFDNVISFIPEIPPGPHTHDEHDEMSLWNEKLKELMKRETNGNNFANNNN
jgi:hypothetical protein